QPLPVEALQHRRDVGDLALGVDSGHLEVLALDDAEGAQSVEEAPHAALRTGIGGEVGEPDLEARARGGSARLRLLLVDAPLVDHRARLDNDVVWKAPPISQAGERGAV